MKKIIQDKALNKRLETILIESVSERLKNIKNAEIIYIDELKTEQGVLSLKVRFSEYELL